MAIERDAAARIARRRHTGGVIWHMALSLNRSCRPSTQMGLWGHLNSSVCALDNTGTAGFAHATQIRHRALLEPLPVQAPLAARIDQPIAHQRLQDMLPARTFAGRGQSLRPEAIQS